MIGQTKNGSFQIGVRRTLPISGEQAWNFLISKEGQRIWLGEDYPLTLAEGEPYTTPGGAKGIVRVINPEVNLRLSWQPSEWAQASTIQIRTIPRGSGTTISFHQEGLPDAAARASMRRRWQQALAKLEAHFSARK